MKIEWYYLVGAGLVIGSVNFFLNNTINNFFSTSTLGFAIYYFIVLALLVGMILLDDKMMRIGLGLIMLSFLSMFQSNVIQSINTLSNNQFFSEIWITILMGLGLVLLLLDKS